MKNLFYISLACIALFVCSCGIKNTPNQQVPYIEYGWDNFPFERIDCYFPQEGTELTYASDKNNSFNLTVGRLVTGYEGRPERDSVEEQYGGFTTATEVYFAGVMFTSDANKDVPTPQVLKIVVDNNREILYVSFSTKDLTVGYEEYNKTLKPDAIFQYLVDTISLQADLRDKSGEIEVVPNVAKIVKGKGIVMYKTLNIDKETGKFIGFDETWTLVD